MFCWFNYCYLLRAISLWTDRSTLKYYMDWYQQSQIEIYQKTRIKKYFQNYIYILSQILEGPGWLNELDSWKTHSLYIVLRIREGTLDIDVGPTFSAAGCKPLREIMSIFVETVIPIKLQKNAFNSYNYI
jgi:hypothetical protein